MCLCPLYSTPTCAGAQTHRNPQWVPTSGWLQPFNPWKHQLSCWHWAPEQLHTRYQQASDRDSHWESETPLTKDLFENLLYQVRLSSTQLFGVSVRAQRQRWQGYDWVRLTETRIFMKIAPLFYSTYSTIFTLQCCGRSVSSVIGESFGDQEVRCLESKLAGLAS